MLIGMNKLLLSLALCLGLGLSAMAQAPPLGGGTLQTETVAAVATYSGNLDIVAARPLRGDDRPVGRFHARSDPHSLLIAGDDTQQDIMSRILEACVQNNISVTLSGPLVKHTNSFGERTSLLINRIEIVQEECGIRQVIIFTWD